MFRSEFPFGIKRGMFWRSAAVRSKRWTNTQFYLRSLTLLCTESVFSYFPVSSFLTRCILLKVMRFAYWKILIYSECLDTPLTCPYPIFVMRKDHISVLCLQLFKKYYSVGSMAFFIIAFVKTHIECVTVKTKALRSFETPGISPRRMQKARFFQQYSWKHVRFYVNVDSQVYRCSSVIRDCFKEVGFWDLSNFVSFRAVWELIFSMASLRYQGLSDFKCWQTHLGAFFFRSTELVTLWRLTSV